MKGENGVNRTILWYNILLSKNKVQFCKTKSVFLHYSEVNHYEINITTGPAESTGTAQSN